ncbi:hypothetical protein GCM10011374_38570 [Kocuria dechangensis]|uniref:Uncharacterized protein n=1 Tax=Kocuria dechangensis TaxID=1176249 RepID=A0A917M0Q0_9MICC|nr:hypothetical protein GCM10011374_38570 [Kocuria dechangensis]
MTDVDRLGAERVEMMLRTAKTRADLQDLVRSLDARNMQLQKVRDDLATQLMQARLNHGHRTETR